MAFATIWLALSCATGRDRAGLPRELRPIPADLPAAEARWKLEPTDLDAIVWYGRRLAYAGRYEDAVGVFSEGLRHHPLDAELLRRGHRYLSLRRFAEARADLEEAARSIEGEPDRIEPDGAPNDFDVPRGTLHTNVWYHLGLAYGWLGEDDLAARSFALCLASATSDDFRVAAAYWRAIALHHLGRTEDARALAAHYAAEPHELMESFDYASLLALFAGKDTRAQVELAANEDPLSRSTLAYGVAMWERMEGRDEEARALLTELVGGGPSAAFGRIAAEVELERMGSVP